MQTTATVFALLVFAKGGQTGDVFFYDVEADGWSLDDKRQPQLPEAKLGAAPRQPLDPTDHEKNNLPDVVIRWKQRKTPARPALALRSAMHFRPSPRP